MIPSRVLKRPLRGDDVERWQLFLLGQELDPGPIDGLFGAGTEQATRAFQQQHGLDADGKVGRLTLQAALALGFGSLDEPDDTDERGPQWPPRPDFAPISTLAERQALFGAFQYRESPTETDRERIVILDHWQEENIVRVEIPQIRGLPGAAANGAISCHRLAAEPILAVFAAWERAGLLDRVLTWGGCYNPRFVRGLASQGVLSNHAFGSAFDINAPYNPLGAEPALVGKKGSVRELVEIANDFGFYWGGHFDSRPDGMHFELAKLVEDPPVLHDLGAHSTLEGLSADPSEMIALPTPDAPMTGTQFLETIRSASRPAREEAIVAALLEGHVPSFLRVFQHLAVSAPGRDGAMHAALVRVLPDYLAIGTDDDFIRVPMSPISAQRIADASGCLLPTTKLVTTIWANAALKLRPSRSRPGRA
ncbi:N-acetylmuramoyl-L-alanine amidase [Minicystis rosea]|nr:N-acetylmuramoyl-L-alanine amidase [Minicystis rosea]